MQNVWIDLHILSWADFMAAMIDRQFDWAVSNYEWAFLNICLD